jgi:predicted TPR repeat methyltransferase
MKDKKRIFYLRQLSKPKPTPNVLEQVHSLNVQGVNLAMKQDFSGSCRLLEQAILLAPNHASTYHNLGAVHLMKGDLRDAVKVFEVALRLDPNSEKTHFNVANLYRKLGEVEMAVDHLKKVLALAPNHHSAAHILAAVTGQTTENSPRDYIVNLFDQYSGTFDQSLRTGLEYKTPEAIRAFLIESLGSDIHFNEAIDLGCGTGLTAQQLRPFCEILHGVDLSSKMIEKAKGKNIYAHLVTADVVEFLTQTHTRYDLFFAADTFVYIGNLEPLFRAVSARAKPGAIFLFSTEKLNVGDYILRPTGRYAHCESYIKEVAQNCGMSVVNTRDSFLRKEFDEWISGELFVLRV